MYWRVNWRYGVRFSRDGCASRSAFNVSISNEVAVTLTTPRGIINYLAAQPQISAEKSRDTIALELWFLLEDQLGIERHKFNEDSRFIEDMGID